MAGASSWTGAGFLVLAWIPHVARIIRACPRLVRAGFVNDWNLEPLCVGLLLTCYGNMHTVQFAIAVGIEFCLYPKIVLNPVLFESINYLSFTIFEPRQYFFLNRSRQTVLGARFVFRLGTNQWASQRQRTEKTPQE